MISPQKAFPARGPEPCQGSEGGGESHPGFESIAFLSSSADTKCLWGHGSQFSRDPGLDLVSQEAHGLMGEGGSI